MRILLLIECLFKVLSPDIGKSLDLEHLSRRGSRSRGKPTQELVHKKLKQKTFTFMNWVAYRDGRPCYSTLSTKVLHALEGERVGSVHKSLHRHRRRLRRVEDFIKRYWFPLIHQLRILEALDSLCLMGCEGGCRNCKRFCNAIKLSFIFVEEDEGLYRSKWKAVAFVKLQNVWGSSCRSVVA